jgi:hypothetical protein
MKNWVSQKVFDILNTVKLYLQMKRRGNKLNWN